MKAELIVPTKQDGWIITQRCPVAARKHDY